MNKYLYDDEDEGFYKKIVPFVYLYGAMVGISIGNGSKSPYTILKIILPVIIGEGALFLVKKKYHP